MSLYNPMTPEQLALICHEVQTIARVTQTLTPPDSEADIPRLREELAEARLQVAALNIQLHSIQNLIGRIYEQNRPDYINISRPAKLSADDLLAMVQS